MNRAIHRCAVWPLAIQQSGALHYQCSGAGKAAGTNGIMLSQGIKTRSVHLSALRMQYPLNLQRQHQCSNDGSQLPQRRRTHQTKDKRSQTEGLSICAGHERERGSVTEQTVQDCQTICEDEHRRSHRRSVLLSCRTEGLSCCLAGGLVDGSGGDCVWESVSAGAWPPLDLIGENPDRLDSLCGSPGDLRSPVAPTAPANRLNRAGGRSAAIHVIPCKVSGPTQKPLRFSHPI